MSAGATPFFEEAFHRIGVTLTADKADLEAKVVQHLLPNPTGHPGHVEEIAAMAAFLASPLSGFINGAVFHVDGGAPTSVH